MDLSVKKDSGSSDLSNHEAPDSISSPDSNSISNQLKTCTDCKTTKTPLWRVGPHGPKSLCNACGIKYRKKKRDVKVKEINMKVIGLKKKCNLGEEEQAAIVLMNLSSGLIYT